MKSPLSLLLVAVAVISLGATAARADHENSDRQYPERHHQHETERARWDDYRHHRPDWQEREAERARWNHYRHHRSEQNWFGFSR